MFDVSHKNRTSRMARARGTITVKPSTIEAMIQGRVPKGDPLAVAKVAAIQAAKNTSQSIPYCHPVPIDAVHVEFTLGDSSIDVEVTVKSVYKTGVEMEALTGASIALLTLYDMLKRLDSTMEIREIVLAEKKGGVSDYREHPEVRFRSAVLVMSDSISAGNGTDLSGQLIADRLRQEEVEVADYRVIPDDRQQIAGVLAAYADEMALDLVITTGGTGCGLRDVTPEATREVLERELPGISETLRASGQERTPLAMLSRGVAGIRGKTIMVNLPGAPRGVEESLNALFPALLHALKMLSPGIHPHDRASGEEKETAL